MTFRHWIRIIGIALVGFGLLCLPSIKRSPQSYGSGLAILSDTGFLLWIAIILIVSGAIAFLALLSAPVGHDETSPTANQSGQKKDCFVVVRLAKLATSARRHQTARNFTMALPYYRITP
jgi:hypothetical protein